MLFMVKKIELLVILLLSAEVFIWLSELKVCIGELRWSIEVIKLMFISIYKLNM